MFFQLIKKENSKMNKKIYPITKNDFKEIPNFRKLETAQAWFEKKYGEAFIENSAGADEDNLMWFNFHLVFDMATYEEFFNRKKRIKEGKEPITKDEFWGSYQLIDISAKGNIEINFWEEDEINDGYGKENDSEQSELSFILDILSEDKEKTTLYELQLYLNMLREKTENDEVREFINRIYPIDKKQEKVESIKEIPFLDY